MKAIYINGWAKWILATIALGTVGWKGATDYFAMQAHLQKAEPMMVQYEIERQETRDQLRQMRGILLWLFTIKCEELRDRGWQLPPGCYDLKAPALKDTGQLNP